NYRNVGQLLPNRLNSAPFPPAESVLYDTDSDSGLLTDSDYLLLHCAICHDRQREEEVPLPPTGGGRRASENDGVTGPSLGPLIGPLPWPIDRPSPGYRPHGIRYNLPANCGTAPCVRRRSQNVVIRQLQVSYFRRSKDSSVSVLTEF
ncbi:unnamed protein product, partial [Cyprideis torosa]